MRLDKIIKENVIKPYSVIANTYKRRHFVEKDFKRPIKEFLNLVGKNGKILDAGCGPGGESKMVVNRGYEVIGIDITPKMVNLAKKSVRGARFLVMDIRKLSFDSGTFDGIWSARTLIHVPAREIDLTLREWKRVLKIGGVLGICVLEGVGEGIEPEYYDPSGKTKTFFHYFSKKEINDYVIKAGFKLVKSYTLKIGEKSEPHIFTFAIKEEEA